MSRWRRQCDIRRNGNLILYCGNIIGYVIGHIVQIDIMFQKEEVIHWARDEKLEVTWQSGLFEKLSVESMDIQAELPVKQIHCCIYQLKENCDPVLKLCSFEELSKKGLQIEFKNYRRVFEGMLPVQSLDEVCEYFDQEPAGYVGRTLMVSDIIEIQEHEEAVYYYIDKGCYRQLKPVKEGSAI